MPVECAVALKEMSKEDFRGLDYLVMRHAFDSQNELGRLADERIYQNDLLLSLSEAGLDARREVPVRVSHGDFCKTLVLDLLVAFGAVYELKVTQSIVDAHRGQLLNYLHLLNLKRGKLVNFGARSVEAEFVNVSMSIAERRQFSIDDSQYVGRQDFPSSVVDLLRDWGTSLTLSLYEEALTHFLGGDSAVKKLIPLTRNGVLLGTQKFQMASTESAFRLTAMNQTTTGYREQLYRILNLSPLKSIHWINIAYHKLTFTTVTRA